MALYKSECYCTNLRRSANAVSEFYDRELAGSELTAPQYYLLINLSRLGEANITHWAEHVGLDRSTMVRNIRPLESRGMITQVEGHGKTYALTDAGRAALDAAVPLWEGAQRKLRSFLGGEDADAVLRIGEKLQSLKASGIYGSI